MSTVRVQSIFETDHYFEDAEFSVRDGCLVITRHTALIALFAPKKWVAVATLDEEEAE